MKKAKSFLGLFLTIIMVLQMGFAGVVNAFGADDEVIDKSEYIPELILTNGPVFNIKGGSKNEITVNIKNPSSYVASNIIVQIEPADVSDNPFNMSVASSDSKISAIAAKGDKNIKIIIDADQTAGNKTYTAKLNYTFYNTFGKKFSSSSTIYLKTESAQAPQFSIQNFKLSPSSILPGQSGTVSFDIFNSGKLLMTDVDVTLTDLDPQGISINNGSNTKTLKQISIGHTQNVAFNIIANASMSAGNYPVKIVIKCKDVDGKEHTLEQSYFISVGTGSPTQKPSLEIQNITEPSGTYGVNQNFTIKFNIVNNGKASAKNIKVTANAAGEGAVVPKSTSIKTVPELVSGASTPMEFIFAGTSLAKSQNYAIEFSVSYEDGTIKDGSSNIVTFSQYAGVNISNPNADSNGTDGDKKTSKPKIIVSDYKSDPLIVMAGEEFDLTMTFLNTHQTKTVKNIKMYLTLSEETSSDTAKTGNIFTPVDSSNTFYFDSIAPKNTVDKKLRLYVVPDAQPKTYTLKVNFEYEDAEGNEYTATELLGINVKQPTKVETGEIYIPETGEVGVPVPVTFEVYNTGKVALNNFMIRIEGDVDTTNKSTFIGNFDAGNTEYFDGTFSPKTIGETPVNIILTYQDPSGETYEIKKEYIMNVTEAMPIDENEFGDFGMEEEKNINFKKIGIIAGVVAVVVIGGVIVFKKIKAKKDAAFIEADDDEK